MDRLLSTFKKLIPVAVKVKLRAFLHRGNKYECPYCKFKSKDLHPLGINIPVIKEKEIIGAGHRLGGCYKCLSSDRERLVFAYLKNNTNFLSGEKDFSILHVAPEKNLTQLLLKQNYSRYFCGDLFTEGYSYAHHVIKMDVLSIPFKENIFDLVLCNHVLEHIETDIDAMKEIYRVLKPGGIAILQVPFSDKIQKTEEDLSITDPKERERIYGQFDHVRIYGKDYFDRLKSVGFNTERVKIAEKYPQYGLNPKEDLFVATK